MNASRLRENAHRAAQAGMTLIELLVAIVMALFMAAALLFVYVGMRSSYLSQDRLAQLQDSQRVAQTLLSTTIEQAGYFVNPRNDSSAIALPAGTINWTDGSSSMFTAGQALTGTGNGAGVNSQSDTITLRFQTANNDGILNCNGGTNTTGANKIYTNKFSISATNELLCAVEPNPPVALASNIGRMQILYGTDTQNKGLIDAYLPATVVTAQNWWARVRSVKIRLSYMDTSKTPPVMFPNQVLQIISLQNKQ